MLGRVIRTLPRVVLAAPGKPVRPEATASQRGTREIAENPAVWDGDAAREVVRRYTGWPPPGTASAAATVPSRSRTRSAAAAPFPAGPCVAVGAGTGQLTPLPAASANALLLADVPLFAAEGARGLAPDGVVVWSIALGTGAPHHVPIATVLAALDKGLARG